ncbi:MAG: hypothetical protein ACOYNR_11240 [Blastocatellia bacterium]
MMREGSINRTAQSSRRCGWLGLFLPLIASVIVSIPGEVQAQSERGYWVKFTPETAPLMVSGKMLDAHKRNSCQVKKVFWQQQVFVKPGDPLGKDGFGKDLGIMNVTSLGQCRPNINEISSISIDLRGNYFNPTLGTFKTVTFSDHNGTRWYNVNIYNASIRVMTGGTTRGYRVLANISYSFSEEMSGQTARPTSRFGGFHITSHRIIEPTIGLRRLEVSEARLRQDIARGIHPSQSAVLGDLVGSIMTFNVRR